MAPRAGKGINHSSFYEKIFKEYLKPNLGHPLAQTSQIRNALQIGPVWIAIDLKVRLKYAQLLIGKCGSDTLGLLLL